MDDFSEFTRHGGALGAARRAFPKALQPWIDLSTGINPVAYPIGSIAADAWTRLPDEASLRDLESAAAARYGTTAQADVVAAPGTQAIIQRLPGLYAGRDVRLLGQTYGEYARVYRAADARVQVVPSLTALAGADVAIVVNPNNPDGRFVSPDDLTMLSRRVGVLIVDEAFADALPTAQSVAPRLPADRLIVLRSFGKIFGLAGLRLGFAMLPPARAEHLRRLLGPWPVSGPAIAIGTAALADDAWLAATRARLKTDGARLTYLLGHVGATSIGSTPLFRLVSHPAAPRLFRALAAHGILARPFAEQLGWLRFGLPGMDAEWARLEAALIAFR